MLDLALKYLLPFMGFMGSVALALGMYYIKRIVLDDHTERLKARLAEAREASVTRKQRNKRERLIRNLIDGVHGRTFRLPVAQLAALSAYVTMLIGLFLMFGGILAYATIVDKEHLAALMSIMGSVLVIVIPSTINKQQLDLLRELVIDERVALIVDTIRDVATKGEVRRIALERVKVSDEESLGRFMLVLYVTAKKYGLGAYVSSFVIWPEYLTKDFKDLPPEDHSLMRITAEEDAEVDGDE